MNVNVPFFPLSIPFPELTVHNTKSEFELFATNFRIIDQEAIFKFMENQSDLAKNPNLSTILRLIGNDHFNDCKYTEALDFYYKSIGLAPIDSPEYGLALADRSEVFYAINNYEECLKDIDNLLHSNYPESKLFNIYMLQSSCYLKVKHCIKCFNSLLNACYNLLKFGTNNTAEIEAIRDRILSTLPKYLGLEWGTNEEPIIVPELKDGENAQFLNASNALEIKSNNVKGRHVIAKTDIEQGDVLFVEEPFLAVRIDDFDSFSVYCSYCLKFSPANIPCKHCAVHFYCSEKCREMAWVKAHKWECYGERKHLLCCKTRLLLNILFDASRNNFNTIVEDESRYGNKINNFAFVNKLVSNKTKMTKDEIRQFIKSAIYIVIYLKKFTNYFEWLHDQPNNRKKSISELYDFIGGIVLKLCMQIYCNDSEIVNIDLGVNESPGIEVDYIGCGLYVSSAMINHSCEANALVSFDKTLKIVRAIKKIPQNTEITIDYARYRGDLGKMSPAYFMRKYKFNCICTKCTNVYAQREEKQPWLCVKCQGKAYHINTETFAQCSSPTCEHIFNMREHKNYENTIAPHLANSCVNLSSEIMESMYNVMQKIYHKENKKFADYFFAAYELYFEKRDVIKCLEVCRNFVQYSEQSTEINEIKIQAYLRLMVALIMYYTQLRTNRVSLEGISLYELQITFAETLNKTKQLLAFYVPPKVIKKYEHHVHKFLNQFTH